MVGSSSKRMGSLEPGNQSSNDIKNDCCKFTHPGTRLRVVTLFTLALAAVFAVELMVMLVFLPLEPEKIRLALLDSLLLITALVPLLYFLAFRPLLQEIKTRKLAESMAKEACLAAYDANKTKDVFFATVSHELRTPLSSILLQAEHLLRSNVDCGTCRKTIQSIATNARIQAHLIEDILDISRMKAGKLRLEKKDVDLGSIIQAATDAVLPATKEKEINIHINLDTSIPPLLLDPHRVQQIIWNLLSNASKFSHHGGQIEISTRRRENWVDIRVSDNGRGIPSEFLPRIFDLFTQADSPTTRTKGLGLGLALVRQLTELHAGKVMAESLGKDKGSVFTVSLPLPTTG